TEIEVPLLDGKDLLKVPAGTQPLEILRLRGKGMPHLRGRGKGDACYRLVLEVPQKLNSKQREALDAFETASSGQRGPLLSSDRTEIEVPRLGGKDLLKVPAGTQPLEILRLRGKGMPHLRGRGKGDACYRLVLEVPQKLNSKQREALEAFETASSGQRGPLLS